MKKLIFGLLILVAVLLPITAQLSANLAPEVAQIIILPQVAVSDAQAAPQDVEDCCNDGWDLCCVVRDFYDRYWPWRERRGNDTAIR